MSSETAPERLGRLVRLRRQQLTWSVRAAANAAGIDRATWTSLEAGTRNVQDRFHRAIEDTLQWPAGSIAAYLKDGATPGASTVNDSPPASECSDPSPPAGECSDTPPADLLPFDDVEQQIWAITKLGAHRRTYILFYRASGKLGNQFGQTG